MTLQLKHLRLAIAAALQAAILLVAGLAVLPAPPPHGPYCAELFARAWREPVRGAFACQDPSLRVVAEKMGIKTDTDLATYLARASVHEESFVGQGNGVVSYETDHGMGLIVLWLNKDGLVYNFEFAVP